jgi:EAL domain-containing protein (putative c-di-GMP-specific phosphodiesterase class I)
MPGRLHLEITESVLIRNDSETMVLLHKLQDFGVHIVLDDFGTGFSCLNYLSTFPFDKIKVDRVFVNGLDHGKVNDTIINAVVSIGQSLKISTVAEGVETQKQRDHLTLTGINEMQGYVFSKPLRASDVEKLFFSAAKSRAKRFTA